MNRKEFIQKSIGATLCYSLSGLNWVEAKKLKEDYTKITILHTNDTHSRLDPFESGDFKGMGGVLNRKKLIDQIRKEEENVLLLDAGDIFQGTPYFNMFLGELEIKAMTMLGYDASTMGNHDFDAGLENFNTQLNYANFPFVVSNYDFSDTILHQKIKSYHIIQKGEIRIGILGIGIELEGLVHKDLYQNTRYLPPLKAANDTARFLKYEKKCQIIIALSHLGYSYASNSKVSDLFIAQDIENVDIIIGGHTHTFLKSPTEVKNKFGKFVIVNQAGWGGLELGRMDIYLDKTKLKVGNSNSMLIKCQ